MSADWQQMFRKLQHGMSYDEMVAVVGVPDHSSATEVTVVMQPSLAGVHAFANGKTIDLV